MILLRVSNTLTAECYNDRAARKPTQRSPTFNQKAYTHTQQLYGYSGMTRKTEDIHKQTT